MLNNTLIPNLLQLEMILYNCIGHLISFSPILANLQYFRGKLGRWFHDTQRRIHVVPENLSLLHDKFRCLYAAFG